MVSCELHTADELTYMVDVPADAGASGNASTELDAGSKPALRDAGAWMPVRHHPLTADSVCAAAAVSAEQVLVREARVNVTVTGAARSLELGRVPIAAECQVGGWYFDSPAAPSRIVACDETCAAITASGATDVQILLGCETKLLVVI